MGVTVPADALGLGQRRGVGGGELAPLVLELRGEGARVPLLVGQAVRLEGLQVVHVGQQEDDHHQDRDRNPAARSLHERFTPWVMPSSWIGCGAGLRAVSLSRISSPISIQLPSSEEPPWARNGVVIPVSGISRVTPPTITNTCRASMKDRPPARILANGSLTASEVARPRCTIRPYSSRRAIRPVRPISSPNAVVMKSLWASGVRYGWPAPRPLPRMPPDAIPYRPWTSW